MSADVTPEPHVGAGTPGVCPPRVTPDTGRAQCVRSPDPCNKVLLEANDEWQLQHRYMGVEAMGEMLSPPPANETLQLPPKAA